ncbi:hypothetical protein O9929_04445 [Vibrio lentus]|nr:hypothetical protein [Vibrio lentus]
MMKVGVLEIPGLPELTDVGSNRCFDLEEQSCLLPQLGSGQQQTTLALVSLAKRITSDLKLRKSAQHQ